MYRVNKPLFCIYVYFIVRYGIVIYLWYKNNNIHAWKYLRKVVMFHIGGNKITENNKCCQKDSLDFLISN